MLRSRSFIAACIGSASLFSLATFAACGDNGSGGSGGSGGTGGQAVGKQPPPPPANKPGDGAGTTFAVKRLYLGTQNADGTPNKDAWKDLGYDIDGRIDKASPFDGHCTPVLNANPAQTFTDGNEGIDNSFGGIILQQIILPLAADAEDKVNENIADGSFTLLMKLDTLGASDEYNPIPSKLYVAGQKATPPLNDGTDVWPLFNEFLNAGNKDNPKVQFPTAYVVGNTWVSGSAGKINLALSVAGFSLSLDINQAVVSFDLAADHKSATGGVISGILDTEAFVTELKKVAGAFSPDLCMGSTVDSIADRIRKASDILKDGTQDGSKPCDGISIGLGFDLVEASLGDVLPNQPPSPDPCAAGGAGGGGAGGAAGGAGGN